MEGIADLPVNVLVIQMVKLAELCLWIREVGRQ